MRALARKRRAANRQPPRPRRPAGQRGRAAAALRHLLPPEAARAAHDCRRHAAEGGLALAGGGAAGAQRGGRPGGRAQAAAARRPSKGPLVAGEHLRHVNAFTSFCSLLRKLVNVSAASSPLQPEPHSITRASLQAPSTLQPQPPQRLPRLLSNSPRLLDPQTLLHNRHEPPPAEHRTSLAILLTALDSPQDPQRSTLNPKP